MRELDDSDATPGSARIGLFCGYLPLSGGVAPIAVAELLLTSGDDDIATVQPLTDVAIQFDDSVEVSDIGAIGPGLEILIQSLSAAPAVTIANTTFAKKLHFGKEILVTALREGASGGTYVALLDLLRRWPAMLCAGRHTLLVIGRKYKAGTEITDACAESAWQSAQIAGLAIYSILTEAGGTGTSLDPIASPGRAHMIALPGAPDENLVLSKPLALKSLRMTNEYRIAFTPKTDVDPLRRSHGNSVPVPDSRSRPAQTSQPEKKKDALSASATAASGHLLKLIC